MDILTSKYVYIYSKRKKKLLSINVMKLKKLNMYLIYK